MNTIIQRWREKSRSCVLPAGALAIAAILLELSSVVGPAGKIQVSGDGIPLPFAVHGVASFAGTVTEIGSLNGMKIIDVSFDEGESYHDLDEHALHFIVTPDDDGISTYATLRDALTKRKRFFGYRYTTRDATDEMAKQSAREADPSAKWDYSDMFSGEFFASDQTLADPESVPTKFTKDHPDVRFRHLSEIPLMKNARYLIITDEPGIGFRARNVVLPDVTFTDMGTLPWNEETFAIPKTNYNTDSDTGYFAYVGREMMKLSGNLLTATRAHDAPVGPENYWWYPIEGQQTTVQGFPVLFDAGFRPCVDNVGSMHPCAEGETPGNVIPLNGQFVMDLTLGGTWRVVAGGSPPIGQYGGLPAVASQFGFFRMSNADVEKWNNGSWDKLATLSESIGDAVSHGGLLYALSRDGSHLYRSSDGIDWETLTVDGIDFPVRRMGLLSKDGHLWLAGRQEGAERDSLLVWPPPPAHFPDRSLALSVLSTGTTNGDSTQCANNTADGHRWRLPSKSEFVELLPSIIRLHLNPADTAFRIERIGDEYFPVMDTDGTGPKTSSNSDNLLCVAEPLPSDTKPLTSEPGCSVTRQPTSASGGQIHFLPADARIAIRLDDSCIVKEWDRVLVMRSDCSGTNCFVRTVSCADGLPSEQISGCSGGCKDGVCTTQAVQ
ncbi:MAG: hypothetical protein PHZ00_03225 [Candidatus Peribacteraceae bacterium]|nr:hypothetical protein [Candidatus Peribacteraceae bacterium]